MPSLSIDIFPWNDNFNTGLTRVDEQHRKLVQMLNFLASHIALGAPREVLGQTFNALSDYAAYHFETEEAIWHAQLAGDPCEIEHQAQHQAFVEEVSRLKTSLASRASAEVAEETLAFLARWLAAHILESDRHLAHVVQARAQGLPLEAAKRQARERMGGVTRTLIDIILSIYATLSANTFHLMRELSAHRKNKDELLRTRQVLQESEVNLRAFFDTIDDFLFVLDGEGRILRVNRAVLERLGHSEAELLGQSMLQVLAASRQDEARQVLADILAGKGEAFSIPLQTADARLIAVETRVVAGQWNGQHALFGVSRDISERQRNEVERDEALALFNAAIEQSPSGILIADAPDARIRVANPVALGIRGGDRRLLTGIELSQHTQRWKTFRLDGSEYPPEELPLSRAILRGEVTENEPLIICDENDQAHWVSVNAAPIRRDGRIVAGIVIFHDITRHKQAEQDLAESRLLLETVINAAPVRICWKDRNSRYLGCNPLFARDAGKSDPGELLGKSDLELGWVEQAEIYRADDLQVMQSGKAKLNFEEVRTMPDGRQIHLRKSKAPLRNDKGETFGVLGIYDDITEQKQADEQRRMQLDELRRWQDVMLNREDRILDLKREVNELLARLGEAPRYGSAASGEEQE